MDHKKIKQKIVVLDFGGQYTHLIANRIRRMGVFAEIHDFDNKEFLNDKGLKGIILSGGPMSIFDKDAPQLDPLIISHKVPVLGLCYGHHSIHHLLHAKVVSAKEKEYGLAQLTIKQPPSQLFEGLGQVEQIWMSHGVTVESIPPGFEIIGSTSECQIAATQNVQSKLYTLQFHPEVTHTPNGNVIFQNFIFKICQCEKTWDPAQYTQMIQNEVQQEIKSKKAKVFMLVSGGVDSTVAFTLLNKALGKENVYGLFINNGLLRKDEYEFVNTAIKNLGFDNFHSIDETDSFLDKLKNVYDPETKRKIIGNQFIESQRKALDKMHLNKDEWVLGQGTIYPDTIESKGTKQADLIKTHHNRVEVIQKMIDEGKVIEPLHMLYKDEVRLVGLTLGLPKELVFRHPFPGPGLGVRCLCSDQDSPPERFQTIQKSVEQEFQPILDKFKSDKHLKCKILPVRSVGVQGDQRTYKNPSVLFNTNLNDPHSFVFPSWDQLEHISTAITNHVCDVNRMMFLIASKNIVSFTKGQDLKLHKSYITKSRLLKLQEADAIAMKYLFDYHLLETVWQMAIILIPFGQNEDESIVLRPVNSTEAMTAQFSKLDQQMILKMGNDILGIGGISEVYYDITNKPPGTIEWE